jgi:hypothetical protein
MNLFGLKLSTSRVLKRYELEYEERAVSKHLAVLEISCFFDGVEIL